MYRIREKPFVADLGIVNDIGNSLYTPMFGYSSCKQEPTYPGRTFVVKRDKPIKVLWENKLVDPLTGLPLPQLPYVPVDQTIHIAHLKDPHYPQSGVPTVTHLHGGFTHPNSDGYPEAWATPNFDQLGKYFCNKMYTYENK